MWLETEIVTTNFGRKDLRKQGEKKYTCFTGLLENLVKLDFQILI